MIREIIKIDEDKCNGCGLCVTSCAESALKIIDGKAKLISEIYCDGLGACLADCPEGALTIEKRESEEFDEVAVEALLKKDKAPEAAPPVFAGCPGSAMRMMNEAEEAETCEDEPGVSRLGHWPVQLMLVSPMSPFLKDADILVCADCVPFAVPDFHERFLKGRAVMVACPKLDDLLHYREKLTAIFKEASPKSITVLRMEVPCCGGIAGAVIEARDKSQPDMKVDMFTIGIDGGIQKQTV